MKQKKENMFKSCQEKKKGSHKKTRKPREK